MFTTTFYSYKGGVGRTLALANVAYVLADRDKKVLVVDFDLEAPGLTTLDAFKTARAKPGVIDYVNKYIDTGEAPSVERYIHATKVKRANDRPTKKLQIDVMPAGGKDETYAGKFAAIDWLKLYEEQSGFLLIEELRESWKALGYDYVLVDSRTGHTDVGGICTRQLPDLVVMVFFPNEQNLTGLCQITKSVHEKGARGKKIDTVFVASRVPRLDDEHGVLKGWLDKFQTELGYQKPDFARVEHYDSLSLLNQSLFVADRPKSGLALQYRKLAALISQRNMEDPVGAFQFVRSIRDTSNTTSITSVDQDDEASEEAIVRRLIKIAGAHEADSVVQYELARAFYDRRRIVESLVSTDLALASIGKTGTTAVPKPTFQAAIHHLRLRAFTEIGSHDEVTESARAILQDPAANETYVLDAILACANFDPASLKDLRTFTALKGATAEQLADIAIKLFASNAAAGFSASILEMALENNNGWKPDRDSLVQSQLILIGGGKFELALQLTESCDPHWREDLATAFNYCMADWGVNGEPNSSMVEELIPLFDGYVEAQAANLKQCLAICYAILRNVDEVDRELATSRNAIRILNRREFSCWTYSNVSPSDFEAHLDQIRSFARGIGPAPEFLTRASQVAASV